MSKWRPCVETNNLYVIPDIHGAMDLLQLIFDRILPLRKIDGIKDKIIFLGDYIDRGNHSADVIDSLIKLKKEVPDQVEFICGNHELLGLETINSRKDKNLSYQDQMFAHINWMRNGGDKTLKSYLFRVNINDEPWQFPANRIKDIVPKEHIEFMQELKPYVEMEGCVFVHGGLPDPTLDPTEFDLEELCWDRSLLKKVLKVIDSGSGWDDLLMVGDRKWEKPIICGHSKLNTQKPIITDKFYMLDCGSPNQLLCMEMGSMQAFMAIKDNDRLVKFEIKETTKEDLNE